MSTYTYSAFTRKREDAKNGESKKDEPPGLSVYVDTVAALVPVEVLALHAGLLKVLPPNERVPLFIAFLICCGACCLIYLMGHILTGGTQQNILRVQQGLVKLPLRDCLRNPKDCLPHKKDYFLMWIPACAFVAWTMLQRDTLFDAVLPNLSEGLRILGGVGLAAAVVIVAWINSQLQDGQDSSVGRDDS